MESFWSMLKRGYVGVFHRMSPEHLHRYVAEFEGRHNARGLDTADQMGRDGARCRRPAAALRGSHDPRPRPRGGRHLKKDAHDEG